MKLLCLGVQDVIPPDDGARKVFTGRSRLLPRPPMLLTPIPRAARTPLHSQLTRTDVSPYSDEFGGQVLNATISLFTHCHIAEAEGTEAEFLAP
jgi:hypothetical protein